MVKQISQSMLLKQWNEAGSLCEQPGIFTLAEGIDKTTF